MSSKKLLTEFKPKSRPIFNVIRLLDVSKALLNVNSPYDLLE